MKGHKQAEHNNKITHNHCVYGIGNSESHNFYCSVYVYNKGGKIALEIKFI